ncbi:MAG: creatininase family protein [Polyangiales bacterium]
MNEEGDAHGSSHDDAGPPTDRGAAATWIGLPLSLAELSTDECAHLLDGRAIALLPVGSTEPHGPHLPPATDAILSEECCRRAASRLRDEGYGAVIAPSIAYGVTRYARDFKGCVGVQEATLIALLGDVVRGLLDDGFAHVAIVNNHLEPAHARAIEHVVQEVCGERGPEVASFPSQLTKRWARTLTPEFKRGDCHAGSYETSLVLAARPTLVRIQTAASLPSLDVSLSRAIAEKGEEAVTFASIGMSRAYTGAPAEGTARDGDAIYALLVEMIVTEVREHLTLASENTDRGALDSLGALDAHHARPPEASS